MARLTDLPKPTAGGFAVGSAPPPKKEDVSLAVNGLRFEGWESVSIKRSIKAISGAFELAVIDKWAQEQVPWKISPGDSCSLSIGKDSLITGYIDSVKSSFTKDSRSISLSGRDKTGDLVDCSAVHKPGTWANISLLTLANILGAPFGIKALSSVSNLRSIPSVVLKNETAFECLETQARLVGVLLMNDGSGNILITRAGTKRSTTSLAQGVNILSASASFDIKERHSTYIVKGQDGGFDNATPEVSLAYWGTAKDSFIKRNRPLLIISEGAATPSICKLRAQWEASVRAAKSAVVQVTVQGWRQADGSLWTLNQLVKLNSSWLGVNEEFLISSIEFKRGNDGTTTQLELEHPGAYTPDPTALARKEPLAQAVQEERARR